MSDTQYPEIVQAVEDFVNAQNKHDDYPDYNEIKHVIVERSKSLSPPLRGMSSLAELIFKELWKIIRRRRWEDMQVSLPIEATSLDHIPGITNKEVLEKVLEDNQKKRRKVDQVSNSIKYHNIIHNT